MPVKYYLLLPLFLISTGLIPTSIEAKSWAEAIGEVEVEADSYWAFAQEHGAGMSPGSAVNEIGVPEHECAIAGRLLGKSEYILKLEEQDPPELRDNMTEDEILEVQIFSVWLSNWAYTAKRLVELEERDIQQIWNLNCVGRMGIPDGAYEDIDDPKASFRQDGSDLFVLGDIESGFFHEFSQWIAKHPETERVLLGSGGGNVKEAIKVGLLIRKLGLDTSLAENCYSACPIVFLGGKSRTIWSPYPRLGFHQVSTNSGVAVSPSHLVYEALVEYASAMGANPKYVLQSMMQALPNDMNEPDLQALCDNGVTTWVQRLCFGVTY